MVAAALCRGLGEGCPLHTETSVPNFWGEVTSRNAHRFSCTFISVELLKPHIFENYIICLTHIIFYQDKQLQQLHNASIPGTKLAGAGASKVQKQELPGR